MPRLGLSVFRAPAYWRHRAEEVRTISDLLVSDDMRAVMERIACDYDRLAALADSSTARPLAVRLEVEPSGPA